MWSAPSTLRAWCEFHMEQGALATLAVQERETKRYLLFDEKSMLCGRRAGRDGEPELARTCRMPHRHSRFRHSHLSPQIFAKMTETGAFSIIDAYLRLAAREKRSLRFARMQYHGATWDGRNPYSRLPGILRVATSWQIELDGTGFPCSVAPTGLWHFNASFPRAALRFACPGLLSAAPPGPEQCKAWSSTDSHPSDKNKNDRWMGHRSD